MPVTETVKHSESVKRKLKDKSSEAVTKKRSGNLRESSLDNQSRGDEVSPPRVKSSKTRTVKKPTTESSSTEKTVKTPISDKVPKKGVQRAKASIALNKTIDEEEKKKHPTENDGLGSSTTLQDSPENLKVKNVRSKLRQASKTGRPGSEKRVASAKKNWATVVKKNSESGVKEEETTAPADALRRELKKEIDTEGLPLSSCSFFEKLQQGVRAYFSSRNSLTEDKPKKKVIEGGIRTGAGVAKGRKEESKARTQGKKIKNKIKKRDSDLSYDRPRLESNSEVQTNSSLNKKPKIIQYIKRKKLYHPKKHYVRIQIPRKGYFYRSLEFRPNQSETSHVNNSRVEPASLSKKSEIQIARLASTSVKRPNIHKKRVKNSRENIANAVQKDDEFSMVHDYLETLHYILSQERIAQEYESGLNRLALDRSLELPISPEEMDILLKEREEILCVDHHPERNKRTCADARNLQDFNNRAIQKHQNGLKIESANSYSTLEAKIQNSISAAKQSDPEPDVKFQILMQYLRDSLGVGTRYGELEISPMIKDFESRALSGESSGKTENLTKPVNRQIDIDRNFLSPLKKKEEHHTTTAISKNVDRIGFGKNKSPEQFGNTLLGGIDLHSELQNYLKRIPKDKYGRSSDVDEKNSCLPKGIVDSTADESERQTEENFDPDVENKSLSKGGTKFQTNKDFSSLATSERETDSKELSQQNQGHTSQSAAAFSEFDAEKKEELASGLVCSALKNDAGHGVVDGSESGPLVEGPLRARRLPLGVSMNSVPHKQTLSETGNTSSKSNKLQNKRSAKQDQFYDTEEDIAENSSAWCPTLGDLVDIYSSVLRQSPRINFKKYKSTKTRNLWYYSIISILRDKLQKKENNIRFINLTETLRECFRQPSDKGENSNLEGYVNMFQEILLSSLSIEQITYLNNVISSLQDPETSAECCKLVNANDSKIFNVERDDAASAAPEQESMKSKESTPMAKRPTSTQTTTKAKSSLQKNKPEENPKKVALSTPTELESVLKSFCNSEKGENRNKTVDKILVNVKLSGNQVLVNDFTYIRDEKFLLRKPQARNEVSELIIENVAGEKTKIRAVNLSEPPKKISENPVKKSKNIKIVLKSLKSNTQNSRGNQKIKNEPNKRNQMSKEQVNVCLLKNKGANEGKDVSSTEGPHPDGYPQKNNYSFQYDQELLKAQHPIDAIIEASESKIVSAESNENVDSEQTPANRKNLENKTSAYEFAAKNRKGLESGLIETKSCMLYQKENKTSVLAKSHTADDLQFEPRNDEKKNRKAPTRPRSTYFCYPSQPVEDKLKKVNKKAEPDSKVTKTTSLKGIKKTDSKSIKTMNSTIMKRGVKTVKAEKRSNSTLLQSSSIKKFDSTRKANSKGIKKKSSEKIKKFADLSNAILDEIQPDRKQSIGTKTNVPEAELTTERRFEVRSERPTGESVPEPHYSEEVKQDETRQSEVAETLDACKNNSPIVIFSTPSDSDDVSSQFAIIRSDSILKTLSHSHLNPDKIESVFNSDSDSKFYPGRISESMKDAQPWVTFILTPQQQAKAMLPANQVKVNDKCNEIIEDSEDGEENQTTLDSIGKFLDELKESDWREKIRLRREKKLKQKQAEKRKIERSNSSEKPKTKCFSYGLPNNRVVKVHDCQNSGINANDYECKRKIERKQSSKESLLAKVIIDILEHVLEKKNEGTRSERECDKNSERENALSEAYGELKDRKNTEKTTSRILDLVINKIKKYEKLVKKNKLILALKMELKRRKTEAKANADGSPEVSNNVDALKCLQSIRTETPESVTPYHYKEEKVVFLINKEESKTETEVKNEREEENVASKTEADTQQAQDPDEEPSFEEVSDSQAEVHPEEVERVEKYTETSFEEDSLSTKTVNKEIEEIIYDKIIENLWKDKVFYSTALFDSLLKEKGVLKRHEKLHSVLQTVSERSRYAIVDLEKNAWIKLHGLLEDLSNVYDVHEDVCMSDSVGNYLMKQLNKRISPTFTVQMKMKLAEFQNSLWQRKSCLTFDLNNVLINLFARLNELTTEVFPRFIYSVRRFFEDGDIRSVKSAQSLNVSDDDSEREARLESLKNEIRVQRLFIEFLISAGSGASSAEVSILKKKISEKLDVLEKLMSNVKRTTRDSSWKSLVPAVATSWSFDQVSYVLK